MAQLLLAKMTTDTIEWLREELRITRETNLAVVRTLQDRINELEIQLKKVEKEAQADYAAWMNERLTVQEQDRYFDSERTTWYK